MYVHRSIHCCIVLSYMVAVEFMMSMTLAWLFSIAMNVHFIVKEKLLGVHKNDEVSTGLHGSSLAIFTIAAVVLLLKFGDLYPRASILIIWSSM